MGGESRKRRTQFSFATVIKYREMLILAILATCELTANQMSMETHVPNTKD